MLRPGKFRLDFLNPNKILIKSYNGDTGWIADNGIVTEMSEGEEKEMAEEGSFYEELAFSIKKNIKLDYKGRENIDEINYHKIEMLKASNDKQTYYINPKTFFIDIITEYSQDDAFKGLRFKTLLKKYELFDGVYIPTYQELYANEDLMRTYKVTSVIMNPEIPDNYFNKPNPWLNAEFEKKLDQFDFWIGVWNVHDYNSKKLVGRSKIEKIVGGFGVEETFYGIPGPFHGKSLNKYNFFTGKWEQFWIDNNGMTHSFSGEFDVEQNKMILKKEEKRRDGILYHQLLFEKLVNGNVRQTWKQSNDQENWKVNFDGEYRSADIEPVKL